MTQDLISRVASLRLAKSKGPEAGPQCSPVLAGMEVCARDPSEDPGAKGPVLAHTGQEEVLSQAPYTHGETSQGRKV